MPPAITGCPDLAFMVHSAESVNDEGSTCRGSKITQFYQTSEPPEWKLRDFAFMAYSSGTVAQGLREVHFGRKAIWAFASHREHCEEVIMFRRGSETRRRWDGQALHEAKVGLDSFFVMRGRQVTEDTPLDKQFGSEWGFWESFFVPILDTHQAMEELSAMKNAARDSYFAQQRLQVACHTGTFEDRPLTISEDLVVRYTVQVRVTEADVWGELCNKIGEDMVLQFPCVLEGKPIKPGSECVKVTSAMDGALEGSRMRKRDVESLTLPVELVLACDMLVAAEWRPDLNYLQKKYEVLGHAYEGNLLNGYSSLGRLRPDPWDPMARLAVNALNKVLARFSDIRSILDIGCGDMTWMQYFVQEHADISYVGVDILPHCLAVNFKRFPKMQFIQTDLSNSAGIEVMPQGCDVVVAKEVFNQMVLPDAVNAVSRIVRTRPRFLLTNIHYNADNSGWEKRIHQHLEYTAWDYNKPPFLLPYPVMEVQRISEDAAFVLYQITPDESSVAKSRPQRIEDIRIPPLAEDLDAYVTVADGVWTESASNASPVCSEPCAVTAAALQPDELGPRPAPRSAAEVGARSSNNIPAPERKPIKGVPAAEFRARCDLIFEKFDKDRDDVLNFEELVALMDAGGRRIDEYDAYAGLCSKLGCDARFGLARRDVYKLFEKAPQTVWQEVYRSINPLAQMVRKGVERLPETFLERPVPNFLFDDSDQTAKVLIDLNDHLFFGAADVVDASCLQAYFGKQRLEVHIVAPGSYSAKDLFLWKFIVTPLTGEIVPEDCSLEIKELAERSGMKERRIVVKITKSKQKRWGKIGQAATGQRI